MSRHPKEKGICRLCGEEKDLTYEHVPPRSSFNKHTKFVSIDFMEYIQTDDIINNPPKGKIRQGGIGYNSLCSECNSFLGSKYVDAYKLWCQAGAQILSKNDFFFVKVTMYDQEPLKILKEIISMFLAINKEWYLKAYPELAEFVRNPDQNSLSDRFRVFMYLTNQGGTRYMHHTINYKPELGGAVVCTEIAYPPFGYVLTIDFDKNINILTNITHFKKYNLGEKMDIKLPLFKLPVYSPFALDYRTKEKMTVDIQAALKFKKEFESKTKIEE